MAAIDLVVLGMIKKQPLSAYDIQKLVEYRNISKWVKISTIHLQKGNSIGRKGVYQKQFRKRRKNAGEGGLFIDRRRGRKI